MGLGRFSYTPLIPALIEDGGLSAAEAGTVAAFNMAGFLIGALAAPWLRRRMEEVALLRACLWVTLACLVASIAPAGAVWLIFWRGVAGITMGVMMVYALAVVTRQAPANRLGAATGIVFTGRRHRDPRFRPAGPASAAAKPCHGMVGARALRRGGRGGGALGMAGRDPRGKGRRTVARDPASARAPRRSA